MLRGLNPRVSYFSTAVRAEPRRDATRLTRINKPPSALAVLLATRGAVAHLDKLHAKHILPGFKDRTAEEREIDDLATDITRVRPIPSPSAPLSSSSQLTPSITLSLSCHRTSEKPKNTFEESPKCPKPSFPLPHIQVTPKQND